MSLSETIGQIAHALGFEQSPPYQWYLMSERKSVTFKKLYENHSLSYSQVLRLKQAQAIYEVIPFFSFLPMGYIMLIKSLNATSPKAIRSAMTWGISLYTITSVAAREARDRVYWPIVQEVYTEIIERQKERETRQGRLFQMITAPKQAPRLQTDQSDSTKIKEVAKAEEKAEQKQEAEEAKEEGIEKTQEEILAEKNKVDGFRVKVRVTYDFIKLKYL